MQTFEMSGWSNAIVDLDNDGWKDLIVAGSNVQDNVEAYAPRKFEEPTTVFRNLGTGKFQNVTATAGSLQNTAAHRGLATGDLDNDGRLDVVVSVLNGKAKLLHNTTQNGNNWISLTLTGTRSNRMGIGAKVRVTTADRQVQYNHVSTTNGYACSSDSRLHFGVGTATAVKEIEVVWPSRIRQVLRDVAVNQQLAITEPAK
jgi:hypothetical protein